MEGEQVRYDHRVPLWIKGSDADHDIAPIHALTCDKGKTAKDLRDIAKIKRIIKKQTEEKPPSRLKGRGFERPKDGYRWPSRKFDNRA